MEKLRPPSDTPLKVFRACISQVEDNGLKLRLESVESNIVSAARSYVDRGPRGTLYRFPSNPDVGGVVSGDEMRQVYERRMAKKSSSGRPFYDRIKEAPRHDRCPLCGVRRVATLDHYLSQKDFPILSVSPMNLVPACSDCNKSKGFKLATMAGEQFLHPYFDDVTRAQWLKARVKEVRGGTLEYYVEGPKTWTPEKLERVRYHFDKLNLNKLYKSHASEEMTGRRRLLIPVFNRRGPAGIQAHLTQQWNDSRVVNGKNSWRTVMFATLASNEWFCNRSFR